MAELTKRLNIKRGKGKSKEEIECSRARNGVRKGESNAAHPREEREREKKKIELQKWL